MTKKQSLPVMDDTAKPESVRLSELKKRKSEENKKQAKITLGVKEGPAKRFITVKTIPVDMSKIMLSDGPKFKADGTLQFRKGGRVCKLAKKGKGKAYGKNS